MATLESHTDYVFTPLSLEERLRKTTGRSLASWIIGELASEEDNTFIRWVNKARLLSSINALRSSTDKADLRLERKLRYDFAKLRAKDQCGRCYARDTLRL
uniref:Uncharacterized protein n=1 Tax=Hyaloperonospora arabidopsidis (strain Emoy2) TaxID=559515 RepID=M4BHW3_HYAAE